MASRFSWKKHFILIFTLACVLIYGFAYVLYSRYRDVHQSSAWVLQSYETLRITWRMLSGLQDMEIGQRGYLLTDDRGFLGPYENALERLDRELALMREQVAASGQAQIQRFMRLEQGITGLRAMYKEQMDGYLSGERPRSRVTADLVASKAQMDGLRTLINDMVAFERELLQIRAAQEKKAEQHYVNTLLIGAALTIGGLLIANALVLRLNTSGRLMAAKLQSTEERLLLAMQGVNDGLFDYDIAKQTIYLSPRFKEMLGYADAEFPDTLQSVNDGIHPDDLEKMQATLNRYIDGETPNYTNVFRMRHKDGSYRWILSRGTGIKDRQGGIARLVGAHTDITDQKRREEHLAHLNNELEGFTYIASHDLRSPLVNLKGFASEMKLNVEEVQALVAKYDEVIAPDDMSALRRTLEQDIPEALHYISSSVEKMDILTTAILDLSRIGRREMKLENVNVREIVERCFKTLAYDISTKHIAVTIGELPEVHADYVALEQVFSNLIDNAIKFLAPERQGIVEVQGRRRGGDTLYSVRDNGRGIAEADMQKVFDMFRRAANSRGIRGNGMGMAYVKATVQRLGGRIWAESKVGEGTVFYFTVPRIINTESIHG